MKILLVGEFSRLHNSLKEGLLVLGHDVFIVGTGDFFKKYPVDFSTHPKYFSDFWFLRKCNSLFYRIFKIDLQKTEKGIRFYFLLKKLKDFDHIQLVNSDAIETHPKFGILLLKKLFDQNKTATKSLLVCGDETPVVDYLLKKEFEYSILTPYFEDNSLKHKFDYTLKYVHKNYQKQFEFVLKNSNSLIVSDIDYKLPMERMGFTPVFIPNPINSTKIEFSPIEISEKVVIFLGINRVNYAKKGIRYFEEALEIIKQKYPKKVEIIISEDVPYFKYIKSYDKAHIVLDMVYAFDQGYNALEAMAKGKVVFTGASIEFEEHYNLTEKVALNAVPNSEEIALEIEKLVLNPIKIIDIGKRARKFIESKHDYIFISKKYLNVWKNERNF
ncbi:glycosyltransferase [Flavobacterium qiangtangense]|uniref:Glycosyltransferase n=1 Tax=Flavobacterium qiangtangense TaxID=1442595 RepID=A0ABW1PRZ5_9FLAO